MKRKPGTVSTVYDVQVKVPIDAWKTVLSTYNLRDARTEARYLRKHEDKQARIAVRMMKDAEVEETA